MPGIRTAEPVEVVVVGAGQAGLTVSYYIQAFGVEHVVLERDRIALAPSSGRDFLPRHSVVAMLERFGRGLPVRQGVGVVSASAGHDGYQLVTTAGRLAARAVVMASGGQRRPTVPALASRLPADIYQCDAGSYRNPASLRPGGVLVVGSGQSGAQIAGELGAAGRDVLLATSRVPRVPRGYRGRDVHEWTVELGLYDQPTEAITDPAQFTEPHPMLSGARGGHTLSYQQLARDGVRLLGRLTEVDGDRLRFGPELPANIEYADRRAAQFRHMVDDYVARTGIAAPEPDTGPDERLQPGSGASARALSIRTERIAAVVWCTGFGPDTGWLRVPVLGPGGHPVHRRGITAFAGLYVAGYPWPSNRGSGILYGVAADAARVAQHITSDARRGHAEPPAHHRTEIQPAGAQP